MVTTEKNRLNGFSAKTLTNEDLVLVDLIQGEPGPVHTNPPLVLRRHGEEIQGPARVQSGIRVHYVQVLELVRVVDQLQERPLAQLVICKNG